MNLYWPFFRLAAVKSPARSSGELDVTLGYTYIFRFPNQKIAASNFYEPCRRGL